jgi:hypothetical protein
MARVAEVGDGGNVRSSRHARLFERSQTTSSNSMPPATRTS